MKLQTPLTTNQNSQPSTFNLTPNDQIETINHSRQPADVNHQINHHIAPTNHKLQKDINNLSESLEKLNVSDEQSHNNATRKYNNEWNVKLDDNSIKQIGFDRDVASFEIAPSIVINIQQQPPETLLSEVSITETENQATTAKSTERDNWTKQEVNVEKDDIGQSCVSLRWVLRQEVRDGQSIMKVQLCAREFEEQKNFPQILHVALE